MNVCKNILKMLLSLSINKKLYRKNWNNQSFKADSKIKNYHKINSIKRPHQLFGTVSQKLKGTTSIYTVFSPQSQFVPLLVYKNNNKVINVVPPNHVKSSPNDVRSLSNGRSPLKNYWERFSPKNSGSNVLNAVQTSVIDWHFAQSVEPNQVGLWFNSLVKPLSTRKHWWILLPSQNFLLRLRWENNHNILSESKKTNGLNFFSEKPLYFYFILPFVGCLGVIYSSSYKNCQNQKINIYFLNEHSFLPTNWNKNPLLIENTLKSQKTNRSTIFLNYLNYAKSFESPIFSKNWVVERNSPEKTDVQRLEYPNIYRDREETNVRQFPHNQNYIGIYAQNNSSINYFISSNFFTNLNKAIGMSNENLIKLKGASNIKALELSKLLDSVSIETELSKTIPYQKFQFWWKKQTTNCLNNFSNSTFHNNKLENSKTSNGNNNTKNNLNSVQSSILLGEKQSNQDYQKKVGSFTSDPNLSVFGPLLENYLFQKTSLDWVWQKIYVSDRINQKNHSNLWNKSLSYYREKINYKMDLNRSLNPWFTSQVQKELLVKMNNQKNPKHAERYLRPINSLGLRNYLAFSQKLFSNNISFPNNYLIKNNALNQYNSKNIVSLKTKSERFVYLQAKNYKVSKDFSQKNILHSLRRSPDSLFVLINGDVISTRRQFNQKELFTNLKNSFLDLNDSFSLKNNWVLKKANNDSKLPKQLSSVLNNYWESLHWLTHFKQRNERREYPLDQRQFTHFELFSDYLTAAFFMDTVSYQFPGNLDMELKDFKSIVFNIFKKQENTNIKKLNFPILMSGTIVSPTIRGVSPIIRGYKKDGYFSDKTKFKENLKLENLSVKPYYTTVQSLKNSIQNYSDFKKITLSQFPTFSLNNNWDSFTPKSYGDASIPITFKGNNAKTLKMPNQSFKQTNLSYFIRNESNNPVNPIFAGEPFNWQLTSHKWKSLGNWSFYWNYFSKFYGSSLVVKPWNDLTFSPHKNKYSKVIVPFNFLKKLSNPLKNGLISRSKLPDQNILFQKWHSKNKNGFFYKRITKLELKQNISISNNLGSNSVSNYRRIVSLLWGFRAKYKLDEVLQYQKSKYYQSKKAQQTAHQNIEQNSIDSNVSKQTLIKTLAKNRRYKRYISLDVLSTWLRNTLYFRKMSRKLVCLKKDAYFFNSRKTKFPFFETNQNLSFYKSQNNSSSKNYFGNPSTKNWVLFEVKKSQKQNFFSSFEADKRPTNFLGENFSFNNREGLVSEELKTLPMVFGKTEKAEKAEKAPFVAPPNNLLGPIIFRGGNYVRQTPYVVQNLYSKKYWNYSAKKFIKLKGKKFNQPRKTAYTTKLRTLVYSLENSLRRSALTNLKNLSSNDSYKKTSGLAYYNNYKDHKEFFRLKNSLVIPNNSVGVGETTYVVPPLNNIKNFNFYNQRILNYSNQKKFFLSNFNKSLTFDLNFCDNLLRLPRSQSFLGSKQPFNFVKNSLSYKKNLYYGDKTSLIQNPYVPIIFRGENYVPYGGEVPTSFLNLNDKSFYKNKKKELFRIKKSFAFKYKKILFNSSSLASKTNFKSSFLKKISCFSDKQYSHIFSEKLQNGKNFQFQNFKNEYIDINAKFKNLASSFVIWRNKFHRPRDYFLLSYMYIDYLGSLLNSIRSLGFESLNQKYSFSKNNLIKPQWSFDLLYHLKKNNFNPNNSLPLVHQRPNNFLGPIIFKGTTSVGKTDERQFIHSETPYVVGGNDVQKLQEFSSHSVLLSYRSLTDSAISERFFVKNKNAELPWEFHHFLQNFDKATTVSSTFGSLDSAKQNKNYLIAKNNIQTSFKKVLLLKNQQKYISFLKNIVNLKFNSNVKYRRKTGIFKSRILAKQNKIYNGIFLSEFQLGVSNRSTNLYNLSFKEVAFWFCTLLFQVCLVSSLLSHYKSSINLCFKTLYSSLFVLNKYFVYIKYRIKRLISYIYQSNFQNISENLNDLKTKFKIVNLQSLKTLMGSNLLYPNKNDNLNSKLDLKVLKHYLNASLTNDSFTNDSFTNERTIQQTSSLFMTNIFFNLQSQKKLMGSKFFNFKFPRKRDSFIFDGFIFDPQMSFITNDNKFNTNKVSFEYNILGLFQYLKYKYKKLFQIDSYKNNWVPTSLKGETNERPTNYLVNQGNYVVSNSSDFKTKFLKQKNLKVYLKVLQWNMLVTLLIGESELLAELEPYREMHWYFLKKFPIFLRTPSGKDYLGMVDYQADEKIRVIKQKIRQTIMILYLRSKKYESKLQNRSTQKNMGISNSRKNNGEQTLSGKQKNLKKKILRQKIQKISPWKSILTFLGKYSFMIRYATLNKRFRESLMTFSQPLISFGPLGIIFFPYIMKNFVSNFDNRSFFYQKNLPKNPNNFLGESLPEKIVEHPFYFMDFTSFSVNPSKKITKKHFNKLIQEIVQTDLKVENPKLFSRNSVNLLQNLNFHILQKLDLIKQTQSELYSSSRYKKDRTSLKNYWVRPKQIQNNFLSLPENNRLQFSFEFLINLQKLIKKYDIAYSALNTSKKTVKFNISTLNQRTLPSFFKSKTQNQSLKSTSPKFTLAPLKNDWDRFNNKNLYDWSFNERSLISGKQSVYFDTFDPKLRYYRFSTNFSKVLADVGGLNNNFSVHQDFGPLICKVYTGLFSKEFAKNYLLVSGNCLSNSENILFLVQALAGEIGLKLFMEDAKRLQRIGNRGINKATKRLEKLFDIAQANVPALIFIEDIHVIGSKTKMIKVDEEQDDIEILARSLLSKLVYRKFHKTKSLRESYIDQHLFKGNSGSSLRRSLKPVNPIPKSLVLYQLTRRKSFSNFFKNQNNSYKRLPTKVFLRAKLSPTFTTNAVLIWKLFKSKIATPNKRIKETPWYHIPIDAMRSIHPLTYSIRVKVAKITLLAIFTMGTRLRLVKDLIKLFEKTNYNSHQNFIVFATTNKVSSLDPALRRPGRLEETISLSSVTSFSSGSRSVTSMNTLNTFQILLKNVPGFSKTFNLIDNTFFSSNLQIKEWSLINYLAEDSKINNRDIINSNSNGYLFTNSKEKNALIKINQIIPGKSRMYVPQFKKFTSIGYNFKRKFNKFIKYQRMTSFETKNFDVLSANSSSTTFNYWQILFSNIIFQRKKRFFDVTYNLTLKNSNFFRTNNFLGPSLQLMRFDKTISSNLFLSLAYSRAGQNLIIKMPEDYTGYSSQKDQKSKRIFDFDHITNLQLWSEEKNLKTNANNIFYNHRKRISSKSYFLRFFSLKIGELLFNNKIIWTSNNSINSVIKDVNSSNPKKLLGKTGVGQTPYVVGKTGVQGSVINNTYNIKADWTDAYSYIKNVVTISSLYSKSSLLLRSLHLEDVNKPRQKSFFESLNAGMLFEYYDFHQRAFFKKNNVSNEETLNSLILQKYMLNNQGRPLRKYVKLENSNRLWLFRILFTELGSLDNISLRATSMNYYYRNKISLKQIFKLSTYQWWNWHLRKPLEQLDDVQDIAYFPCGDKYYNPRHRRWASTNGFWSYWFSFDKNFYFDLYEQYMFESFQTAYLSLDENREILDYLAKLFIYLEKVSETELFLIFNRYKL